MKKWLLIIMIPSLGILTLITISLSKELLENQGSSVSLSVSSREPRQSWLWHNSLAQEEELDGNASNIAQKAWESGYYENAQQQIATIKESSLKVEMLRKLAQAHLSVGQNQQALTIINQAWDLDKQSDSYEPLFWVKDLLMTGQEQQVQEIVKNLKGDYYQLASTNLTLAESYFALGRLEKAFDFISLIPSDVSLVPDYYPNPRNELLHKIVAEALQRKNFDLATRVGMSFPLVNEQVIALKKIAQQYVKNDNISQAKLILGIAFDLAKTIDNIPVIVDNHNFWSEPNSVLLITLARDYYNLGEQQKALEILSIATESVINFDNQYTFDILVWNRSHGLSEIADIYLDFGQQKLAINTLNLATKEANKLKRNRDIMLREYLNISRLYVAAGNPTKAKEIWQQALDKLKVTEPISAQLILDTAKVGVLLGEKKQALAFVKETKSLAMQLEIALQAKDNELASDLIQETIEEINQLSSEEERMNKLEQLAFLLSDNLDLGLRLSSNIKNPREQASFILKIVQKDSWEQNKNIVNQAVNLIRKISDEQKQETWFRETVKSLVDHRAEEAGVENEPSLIPSWSSRLAVEIARQSNNQELLCQVLLQATENELKLKHNALVYFRQFINSWDNIQNKEKFFPQLLEIFQLSLSLKETALAWEIAQQIPEIDYQIVALRQVAQQYGTTDNKQTAAKVLAQTVNIAQTIKDAKRKEQVLQAIAEQEKTW